MAFQRFGVYSFVLLLYINSVRTEDSPCPFGFTKHDSEPVCFRLKKAESFKEKFEDCTGNIYSLELHRKLKLPIPEEGIWADYRSLEPGFFFIDWSYTNTIGSNLSESYIIKSDSEQYSDGAGLCLVLENEYRLTQANCYDEYQRYCVIEQYSHQVTKSCSRNADFLHFSSPRSTCLFYVSRLRATWKQVDDLCKDRQSDIIHRGWMYANYHLFHKTPSWEVPIGAVVTTYEGIVWYIDENNDNEMTDESLQVSLNDRNYNGKSKLTVRQNGSIGLVNNAYVFKGGICEKTVPLEDVQLTLYVDGSGNLKLTTDKKLSSLYCFTDAEGPTPTKVHFIELSSYEYELNAIDDGYYWCVHGDSKKYHISESEKLLFIRDKQELVNRYAIEMKKEFEEETPLIDWEKTLAGYIQFLVRSQNSRSITFPIACTESKEYGLTKIQDNTSYDSSFNDFKLKKIFRATGGLLVHANLTDITKIPPSGCWNDLLITIKPVFYCRIKDSSKFLSLGQSYDYSMCITAICVGDFNHGVQLVETKTENCIGDEQNAETQIEVGGGNAGEEIEDNYNYNWGITDNQENTDYTTNMVDNKDGEKNIQDYSGQTTKISFVTEEPKIIDTTLQTLEELTPDTETPDIENVTIIEVSPTTESAANTENSSISAEQQVQQVIDKLQELVDSGQPIPMENVISACNQVDEIFGGDDDVQIPSELLHLLDKISYRVDLHGSSSLVTVKNNIAILVADSDVNSPVAGLKVERTHSDHFVEDAFEIINEGRGLGNISANNTDAVVQLPNTLIQSEHRISFVVFHNDKAFKPLNQPSAVNSRILSINVKNVTRFRHQDTIDIHLRPLSQDQNANMKRICAFWQFSEDGNGFWSEDGCTLIPGNGNLDICRCTHLTHFAEVLIPRTKFSARNEDILELISLIGCFLSLLGLTMVGVTAFLFRTWHRDFSNKIWLQLCISVLFLILSFLIIVFAKFNEYTLPCMLTGIVLHYSVLSSFCWMLIAAILSYRRLVLVFTKDASHKLLRAATFSWGVPAFVIGLLLLLEPHAYEIRFKESVHDSSFCYPSGIALYLTIYLPISIMLLVNWTLFIIIVRSVFGPRRVQRHGETNDALRCASVSCLLVFLFGMPWVSGLFASNIVAAYLFDILTTFQGFVLFLFFVVGNKKTRDLWLNELKIKRTQKVPVTSSTFSNRSSNWKLGTGGALAMETNSSKPRSLTSVDDARFS